MKIRSRGFFKSSGSYGSYVHRVTGVIDENYIWRVFQGLRELRGLCTRITTVTVKINMKKNIHFVTQSLYVVPLKKLTTMNELTGRIHINFLDILPQLIHPSHT